MRGTKADRESREKDSTQNEGERRNGGGGEREIGKK